MDMEIPVNPYIISRPLTRACKIPFAVMATTLLCAFLAAFASAEPARAADCSGSLQAKIDAAPAGGTVRADACVYREQISITKPLTLEGQPGSEIRGSEVWTGWTARNGKFTSSEVLPRFYQEDVSCQKGTKRCAWPEQVFVNGEPLAQVASDAKPASGQFKVSTSRKVVLGVSPVGKTVEVTSRKHWITGTTNADGVTIRGFTMRHAANDWRCGALQARPETTGSGSTFGSCRFKGDGDDWNLLNNRLLHAAGAVVSVRGDNANIEGNEIAYGGQLGIHNPGDGSVVSSNHIHHNNTEAFCRQGSKCVGFSTDGNATATNFIVESGGIKVAGGMGFVKVLGNEVDHNDGQGIWFDVGTHDVEVANNRVHHNTRRSIFFEISDRAQIHHNVVWENGWGTPQGVDGAGIEVGNSDNAEVYENTLAWNADGITVRCYDRDPGDQSICQNTAVHDNVIMQEETPFVRNDSAPGVGLAWLGGGGSGSLYDASSGNSGTSNDYYFAYAEKGNVRFAWNSKFSSLGSFDATLGEEEGSYLTSDQKDAVVAGEDVPASPEAR